MRYRAENPNAICKVAITSAMCAAFAWFVILEFLVSRHYSHGGDGSNPMAVFLFAPVAGALALLSLALNDRRDARRSKRLAWFSLAAAAVAITVAWG